MPQHELPIRFGAKSNRFPGAIGLSDRSYWTKDVDEVSCDKRLLRALGRGTWHDRARQDRCSCSTTQGTAAPHPAGDGVAIPHDAPGRGRGATR